MAAKELVNLPHPPQDDAASTRQVPSSAEPEVGRDDPEAPEISPLIPEPEVIRDELQAEEVPPPSTKSKAGGIDQESQEAPPSPQAPDLEAAQEGTEILVDEERSVSEETSSHHLEVDDLSPILDTQGRRFMKKTVRFSLPRRGTATSPSRPVAHVDNPPSSTQPKEKKCIREEDISAGGAKIIISTDLEDEDREALRHSLEALLPSIQFKRQSNQLPVHRI